MVRWIRSAVRYKGRLWEARWVWVLLCLRGTVWGDGEDPVALFQRGEYEAARIGFRQVAAARPDDPVALYYLGRLTADFARSRAYFEAVVKRHPKHDLADDALFELAEAVYAGPMDRYEAARAMYRRLLAEYPVSSLTDRAHYRIGLTFLAAAAPDSALVSLRRADLSSEAGPLAGLAIIEALTLKGNQTAALAEAQGLLAKAPVAIRPTLEARIRTLGGAEGTVGTTAADPPHEQVPNRAWGVQVGAFRNQGNALRMRDRLRASGFSARVERRENRDWLFVVVGPYANREAALKGEKALKKDTRVRDTLLLRRP